MLERTPILNRNAIDDVVSEKGVLLSLAKDHPGNETVLARVAESKPDLVVVGNAAGLRPGQRVRPQEAQ